MRVSLLGPFGLEVDGRSVDLKSRKCRALLAFLAVRPGVRHTREQLASLLWGDMGDARARANLRQAVADLRDALGDPDGRVVVSADGCVSLAPGAVEVDALTVLSATESPREADWNAATASFQGEFLEDLALDEAAFDDWRADERRRFARVACDLFARIASARRRAGDEDGAEAALFCWLGVDAASEEAHRALMELYAETGRRAKALEQFARCKEALARTYGVAPGGATMAIHAAITAAPPPRPPSLPLPSKPSIAVLPFDTLGAEQAAWLGDGIAEDIVVALSRFERLLVISRQSSFVFRGPSVDVREVGRALGVHYVLSGSVRRGDGKVRLLVQLADAQTAAAVWANTYEASPGDLVALEADVLDQVVATLAGRVEADRIARARKAQITSLEAYDCLLKAKLHHHRFTAADNLEARLLLERAVELQPDMALAHAWMACVLVQGTAFAPDPLVFDRAARFVQSAAEFDEGESECHRVLASYHLIHKRWDEAEHHQARALALNPNDDRIVCQQGELLAYLGNPTEGLRWVEKAKRLNPYHGDAFHGDHARCLYHLGDAAGARKALLGVSLRRPAHHAYLAACSVRLGDRAAARAHLAAARGLNPAFNPASFAAGLPYRATELAAELAADLEIADAGRGPASTRGGPRV